MFSGWSGAATGTDNPATVAMDADKTLTANFAADDDDGVILLTRNARGGGTLNCGEPANLCDGEPNPAIPCFGMYMVRFKNAGQEQWATQLSTQSAQLPPYSTGPDGPMVHMIWWYQHHGRLAWDDATDHFSMVCAKDRGGGIAQPNGPGHLLYTSRDLATLSVGDIVAAGDGGYWITASDQGSVLLMHFSDKIPFAEK